MPALVSRRPPGYPPLAPVRVRRLAEGMLAALDMPGAELSLLLTDDATIHRLNRRHRNVDRPTDVLAFPLVERSARRAAAAIRTVERSAPWAAAAIGTDKRGGRRPVGHGVVGVPTLLGDIVISLETALRQARGRRRPLLHEVRFLLAHGLLHLLGYDHDTPLRKRRMSRLTRKLVRSVPLPGESTRTAASGARRGSGDRTGSRDGSRKRLVQGPRGRP